MSVFGGHKRRIVLVGLLIAGFLVVTLLVLDFWPGGSRKPVAPEVRIAYSSSYTNTIGGLQPQPGNTFLVIHLTVQNLGYQNFTANPVRDMYVTAGGQSYNVSAVYIFLPNFFPASNLNNTQSAAGDVAFEVPQGNTSFTPQWRMLAGEQVRLEWVAG